MVAMALCLIPSHALQTSQLNVNQVLAKTASAPTVIPVFKLSMVFSHTTYMSSGMRIGVTMGGLQPDDGSERHIQRDATIMGKKRHRTRRH